MLCAAQNRRMPEHNHYSTTPQSAKSGQAKRIKQDSTEIHWLLSPPPHKGAGPTGSSLSLHGITHWDAICKIVKVKPTFILQKTKRDSMCWWLLDYTGKWGRKQIKLCHFLYTHRKISPFMSTNSPWLGTGGIVPWVKDPFPFKAPTWNPPLTVTESRDRRWVSGKWQQLRGKPVCIQYTHRRDSEFRPHRTEQRSWLWTEVVPTTWEWLGTGWVGVSVWQQPEETPISSNRT